MAATMSHESRLPARVPGWLAGSLLALASVAAPAQSQVYTVDIRPVLNDLDIKIEHVADSRMLVVNLTNNSPTRVRCDLRFDASPQTPQRTTRHINPGQRGSGTLRAQRRWFSVTVDVECVPAPR
jgi:hypothetical protein